MSARRRRENVSAIRAHSMIGAVVTFFGCGAISMARRSASPIVWWIVGIGRFVVALTFFVRGLQSVATTKH